MGDNDQGLGQEGIQTGTNNQDSQTNNLGWRAGMKSEIRENEFFKGMDSVTALGNSALEMNERLKSSISVPGEQAKPEDWDKFYQNLGRPDKAEGYEFAPVPEGLKEDENLKNWFRKMSFEAGFSKDQASKLYDGWNQYVGESLIQGKASLDAEKATSIATLKTEWGTEYDQRQKQVDLSIDKWGGEGFRKTLLDRGLLNDIGMIRFLDNFSNLVSEDSLVTGGDSTNGEVTVPKGQLHFTKSFPKK